eukprot:PhM_4_TR18816/c1_g1_i1/m.35841
MGSPLVSFLKAVLKFILYTTLDILAGIAASFATLLDFPRLPSNCSYFSKIDRHKKLWEFGAISFVTFIIDILTLPLAIVVFCSWRSCQVASKLSYHTSWKRFCRDGDLDANLYITKYFFAVLVDIPCIILGVLSLVMNPIRAPKIYFMLTLPRSGKATTGPWRASYYSWRLITLQSFFIVVIDWLMLPLWAISICSWRLPHLVKRLRKTRDIHAPVITPTTTLYRNSYFCDLYVNVPVLQTARDVVIDMPCMLCLIICILFPWRWHSIAERAYFTKPSKKTPTDTSTDPTATSTVDGPPKVSWRLAALVNSVAGLSDVLLAVFTVLPLLSWRALHVVRCFTSPRIRDKLDSSSFGAKFGINTYRRTALLREIGRYCIDVPVVVLLVFTVVTLVRLPALIRRCRLIPRHAAAQGHPDARLRQKARLDRGLSADVDAPVSWYDCSYHHAIGYEFVKALAMILIIPNVLILLVTVIRVPICVKKLKRLTPEALEKAKQETSTTTTTTTTQAESADLELPPLPAASSETYDHPTTTTTTKAVTPPTTEWDQVVLRDKLFFRRVVVVAAESFKAMLDIILSLPVALFILITMFRVTRTLHSIRDVDPTTTNKWVKTRLALYLQAVLFIRDVPFLALFLGVIVVTLYRLPQCVRRLREMTHSIVDPVPKLTIQDVRCEFTKNSGWVLKVSGLKPKGFTFRTALLRFQGKVFWESFTRKFGRGVKILADTFLPLSLVPTYINPSASFPPECDAFSVDIHLKISIKRSTIIKKLKMLDTSAAVDIVVEYDDVGTLFVLTTTPDDLLLAEETGAALLPHTPPSTASGVVAIPVEDNNATPVAAPPPRRGKYLCDVFWKVVGPMALMVPVDILVLVLFVLLHILPHRAYVVYRAVFVSEEGTRLRRIVNALDKYRTLRRRKAPQLARRAIPWVHEYYRDCMYANMQQLPEHAHRYRDATASLISTLEFNKDTHAAEILRHDLYFLMLPIYAYTREVVLRSISDENTHGYYTQYRRRRVVFVPFTTPFASSTSSTSEPAAQLVLHSATKYFTHFLGNSTPSADSAWLQELHVPAPSVPSGAKSRSSSLHLASDPLIEFREGHTTFCSPAVSNWFEREFTTHQRQQEDAFKKIPWCSAMIPWSATRVLILKNFLLAFLDMFTLIAALLLVVTVYRLPSFILHVRRGGGGSWRRLVFWHLKEMFLVDFLYLLSVVVITCTVRLLPVLLYRMYYTMKTAPSFDGLREDIRRTLEDALEELFYILSLVRLWRTYKVVVATVLWGLFTPAELILRAVSRSLSSNKELKVICTLFFVAITYALPCVWVYAMTKTREGEDDGADDDSNNLYFVGMQLFLAWNGGVIVVICGIAAYVKFVRLRQQASTTSPFSVPASTVIGFLRFSWPQLLTIAGFLLEAAQLSALVLIHNPRFSSGTREGLVDFAEYVLVPGDRERDTALYLAIAFSLLSFVVCSLPIVIKELLEWSDVDVSTSAVWGSSVSFLTTIAPISIMFHLWGELICFDNDSSANPNFLHLSLYPAESCTLQRDSSVPRGIALLAGLCLVHYIPTVLYRHGHFTDATSRGLDIVFAEPYNFLRSIVCIVLVPASVLCLGSVSNEYEGLYFGLHIGVISLLLLWLFQHTRRFPDDELCSVREVMHWRVAAHIMSLWTAVAAVLASFVSESEDDSWPTVLLFVGWGVIPLVAVGSSRYVKSSKASGMVDSIAAVQQQILTIGGRVRTRGNTWGRVTEKALRASVMTSGKVPVLAAATLQLADDTHIRGVSEVFSRTFGKWRRDLAELVSPSTPTTNETVQMLEEAVQALDNATSGEEVPERSADPTRTDDEQQNNNNKEEEQEQERRRSGCTSHDWDDI